VCVIADSLCVQCHSSVACLFPLCSVQSNHFQLIRQIGGASTILLKNTKGALPLNINNIKRM
jgi:hypothetical protein